MPLSAYMMSFSIVLLLQQVFDWSGVIGAVIGGFLGLIGVIYGVRSHQKIAESDRKIKELELSHTASVEEQEKMKAEAFKDIETTKTILGAYTTLVEQLKSQLTLEAERRVNERKSDKDDLRESRWHLRVCERQQSYLQARLLKEGVLTADDLVALQKLEVEVLPT